MIKEPSCADDHDPEALTVDAARLRILDSIVPMSLTERVPVRSALSRVLAETVIAPVNVPAHVNSAMDGYALKGTALPTEGESRVYQQAGRVMAGQTFAGSVAEGECIRIMTGAPMPTGTDTVVMQEQVEVEGDRVTIGSGHRQGQNVRQAGEDLTKGQAVFNPGKWLDPADIGVMASMGFGEVAVVRRPTVAFFSTGDELRSIGEPLGEGEVYDSNRYTVYGMLTRLGCNVLDMGVITDDPEKLREAFEAASRQADVVITTGGVSVGEADYIHSILEELGEVAFWKLAIKPGRPLTHGKLGNALFFGLPGNPVAVVVSFYQFVQPALRYLMSSEIDQPLLIPAKSSGKMRKRPGRTEFARGVYTTNENGEIQVDTTGVQGSGILTSMSRANCFIVLGDQQGEVNPGDIVTIQPFASLG
ncbi:MAG: bifunctional molybdopterin-guanine dinucleotide biosynthesis adaptor protein MobB/molybdopterin molybdotransferase MoeA [Methylococcales bacterium]|nr:bifunctional molybdopterin-guanine dinucleotide biosynthesis adaptor protein MobB/molybdopterin molybdotransferase MoeA [Methylococcales bacterium]